MKHSLSPAPACLQLTRPVQRMSLILGLKLALAVALVLLAPALAPGLACHRGPSSPCVQSLPPPLPTQTAWCSQLPQLRLQLLTVVHAVGGGCCALPEAARTHPGPLCPPRVSHRHLTLLRGVGRQRFCMHAGRQVAQFDFENVCRKALRQCAGMYSR